MINLLREKKVFPTKTHFEFIINKKIVQIAKWVDDDFSTDYEFIKGEELLTEDEREEILEYINEQKI
jgi:hypothetical protein